MPASTSSAWSCARETRRPTPAPAGRCVRRSGSSRSARRAATATPSCAAGSLSATSRSSTWSATTCPWRRARRAARASSSTSRPPRAFRSRPCSRRARATSRPTGPWGAGSSAGAGRSTGSRRCSKNPRRHVAEQQLVVPGLRAGFYLCFFGMHVLGPEVLELLDEQHAAAPDGVLGLVAGPARARVAPALPRLSHRRPALRHRRALRAAGRAAGAVALRPRPGPRAHAAHRAARRQVRLIMGPHVHRPGRVSRRGRPRLAIERWCAGRPAAELLAGGRRARRHTAAARRTSTSASARCSSWRPSTAIICPRVRRSRGWAACPTTGSATCSNGVSKRPSRSSASSQRAAGPSETLSSAFAAAYQALAFQTLADQVRRTVRSTRGNAWMFRLGHPADQPLRVRPELLRRDGGAAPSPILRERTPVRMDLTHCGWSDIFFLGMDFPEGARVLNVSIDLGVHGRDPSPRPPVEAYLRVIDEPVIRLASVDLEATAVHRVARRGLRFRPRLSGSAQGRDHRRRRRAAGHRTVRREPRRPARRACSAPGRGFELVSNVNRIPKGSRLAVSTTLLGALHRRAACAPPGRSGRSPGRWRKPSAAWSRRAPSSANGWAVPAAAGRTPAASGPASS